VSFSIRPEHTAWFNIARRFAETENTVLLGQQEGGSIAGLQERSGAASKTNSSDNQKQDAKDKKLSEFLQTIQTIQNYMDRLAKSIEKMEDNFRQRDGDAWREKLALEILGEDDIPQQEPGEDITTYRERLEKHLINEMLNSDGTIKDKYKNDPKYGDYAEWAQKQYHLNNAKALVTELDDNGTSPQRREQILDEMRERGYVEEMMLADREAKSEHTQASARDILDNQRDEEYSQAQPSDAALKFT